MKSDFGITNPGKEDSHPCARSITSRGSFFNKNRMMTEKKTCVKSIYSCPCEVCRRQKSVKMKIRYTDYNKNYDTPTKIELFKGEIQNYTWILEHLVCQNEHIRGAPILVPETVVFKNGKPKYLMKSEKAEHYLRQITNGNILQLSEIMKYFMKLGRKRRKGIFCEGPSINIKPSSPKDIQVNLNSAFHKTMSSFSLFESGNKTSEVALMRFKEGIKPTVQILTESEFMKKMMERSGSSVWRKLNLIQLCVVSKAGLADTKIVNFFAPLDEDNPAAEINYSFKHFASDSILKRTNTNLYAIKICLKLAYYISKVHYYEVLQMKAYFIKDDNNDLWFYHATDIHIRPIISKMQQTYLYQKIDVLNAQTRDTLIKELDEYNQLRKGKGVDNVEKIFSVMKENYIDLKKRVGIRDEEAKTPPESETDDAFMQLRPKSPYKLSQLLNPSFNAREELQKLAQNDEKNKSRIEDFISNKSNSELVDSILRDEPIYEIPKKKINRKEYAKLSETMRIFHNLKPTSRREKMKSYSTSRRPQSANPVKAKPNLERAESYSFQKKSFLNVMRGEVTENDFQPASSPKKPFQRTYFGHPSTIKSNPFLTYKTNRSHSNFSTSGNKKTDYKYVRLIEENKNKSLMRLVKYTDTQLRQFEGDLDVVSTHNSTSVQKALYF